MNREKQTAKYLLQIKAIKLNLQDPFIWASGRKSPIYCDNRKLLSFPGIRDYIKAEFVREILQNYSQCEVIAGVATAGIPMASLIADQMKQPLIYVRDKPKSHGMANQIEGVLETGKKVIVIEDLISTGMSSMKAVRAITGAGADVLAVGSIFTYELDEAKNNFSKANIPTFSLSNYSALIEEGMEEGIIESSAIDTLKQWRKAPDDWGKSF